MHHKRKAFTLIELIVVVMIIGLLATALTPKLLTIQSKARDTQRQIDIKNIAAALSLYHTDYNAFPLSACNASSTYVNTIEPTVCQWNHPYATTWSIEYSQFTGFLTKLEGKYLSSVPKDPQHPKKRYFYWFDPTLGTADRIYIENMCTLFSWYAHFNNLAVLWYSSEIRQKTDIVRACPSWIPWDYVGHGTINRTKFAQTIRIFDDKYAPIWEQKVPGECFDKKKNDMCE